jgi:hypothetical protein
MYQTQRAISSAEKNHVNLNICCERFLFQILIAHNLNLVATESMRKDLHF